MKKFNSIEEAKEYGRNNKLFDLFDDDTYLGLNALRTYAKNEKQNIILCETCKEYEDNLWSDAYKLSNKFYDIFASKDLDHLDHQLLSNSLTDLASEIRDLIIKRFEEDTKLKFVNVYDEF